MDSGRVAFVEAAPFYEIKGGIVYVRGSLGDGYACHVMSVKTLRQCVAGAARAISEWEAERVNEPIPFPKRGHAASS